MAPYQTTATLSRTILAVLIDTLRKSKKELQSQATAHSLFNLASGPGWGGPLLMQFEKFPVGTEMVVLAGQGATIWQKFPQRCTDVCNPSSFTTLGPVVKGGLERPGIRLKGAGGRKGVGGQGC